MQTALVLCSLFALSSSSVFAQDAARSESRELAEIRLLVAADRKLPEARERLAALRAVLTAGGSSREERTCE